MVPKHDFYLKKMHNGENAFEVLLYFCYIVWYGMAVVVISVYLPYQCPDNEVEYLEKLGYINAVTNDLDTKCFVIVGDWNANIRNGGESMFARHMSQLCMDNSYIISSQALLPTESYTHVSEAWGSVSWLDHIVSK